MSRDEQSIETLQNLPPQPTMVLNSGLRGHSLEAIFKTRSDLQIQKYSNFGVFLIELYTI